jgi:hypothetical protein
VPKLFALREAGGRKLFRQICLCGGEMTIAELIDELTKLPNKERDVDVHVHGALSGILPIVGIDQDMWEGQPNEFSIYLDAKEAK